MTNADVAQILAALDPIQVTVWVDGGWGVDALVGRPTRRHADLDLALDRKYLAPAMAALEEVGFTNRREAFPGPPARFVMTDERRRAIDLHPLTFDAEGNGWQQLTATGDSWGCYPRGGLAAQGVIGGRQVPCLTAELQLRFHQGYRSTARDRHDVRLLLERSRGEPIEVARPAIAVLFVETRDEPEAIGHAWRDLEQRLGSLRGRHFFGTFAGGRYRAGVETAGDEDPATLGLHVGAIPGGRYLRLRLDGKPPALYDRIPAAFAALMSAGVRDVSRPSIEWYRSRNQVDLLMPLSECG